MLCRFCLWPRQVLGLSPCYFVSFRKVHVPFLAKGAAHLVFNKCFPYPGFAGLSILWDLPDLHGIILVKQFICDHILFKICSYYLSASTYLITNPNQYLLQGLQPHILYRLHAAFHKAQDHFCFFTHQDIVDSSPACDSPHPHLLFWVSAPWGLGPCDVFVQSIPPVLHMFILNYTLNISNVKIICKFDLVP